MHKRCSKCLSDKPVSEFGKHSKNRDGLRAHCRKCGETPPSQQRCKHCGTEWERKGRGPVPPLCPTCESDHSWCPECLQALKHAEFYASPTTRTGRAHKCKACARAYRRTPHGWRVSRSNQLKHAYGITLEQYEARIIDQGGKCACCKGSLRDNPVVDHDHTSGKVRGILCYGCNTGLGKLGDNAEGAHRAEMYLWQSRNVLAEIVDGHHYLTGVA